MVAKYFLKHSWSSLQNFIQKKKHQKVLKFFDHDVQIRVKFKQQINVRL